MMPTFWPSESRNAIFFAEFAGLFDEAGGQPHAQTSDKDRISIKKPATP